MLTKNILDNARKQLDSDPHLAVYIVRDYQELVEWGLDDLAWAMHREGYVPRGDAQMLLDRIERHLNLDESPGPAA